MSMTKTKGATAVMGVKELISGIDWRIAEIRYTKFAGLTNWKMIAKGRKVIKEYLVVSTLFDFKC